MENQSFQALLVSEKDDEFSRKIVSRKISDLPTGDILIRVSYSSLNYKDALSATGNKGVTRRYPHTPGIDAAGEVMESNSDLFQQGDQVIVCGYDLGMNTPGGYGEYIRVPVDWVIHCPANLSLFESMIFGTAGFTAAQSVSKIIGHGIHPDQGKILITGVTGGVGSISAVLLNKLGYQVTGVSGKADAQDFFHDLGVKEIITREQATDQTGRLLLRTRWAGVIDTVGGEILSTALKTTQYGGAVTCCGNAASADLSTSVYPFILRGITLYGIDSGNCPLEQRVSLWEKLAGEWKLDQLQQLATQIDLSQINTYINLILQGSVKGRIVVNLQQ